jgi:hypothetical protein
MALDVKLVREDIPGNRRINQNKYKGDDMDSNQSGIIPLLKYPVLILSILIAMVFARWVLGIDFSRLSKVGTGGVEFFEKEQQISTAMNAMEERLNESLIRIQNLEVKLNLPGAEQRSESQNFETTQRVSEETAQLARSASPGKETILKNRQGYIWIGNYNNSSQKWEQPQLATLEGQPPSRSPSEMVEGSQYTVLGNMVLRDGLPENNVEYFRGRKNIGVIPRGTRITFLSTPKGIDREYAVQYWVKVEINE